MMSISHRLSSRDLPLLQRDEGAPGAAQMEQGIGIVSFLTAMSGAMAIFVIQMLLFLLLRNKIDSIYKPKISSRPQSFKAALSHIIRIRDREIINSCGLDAYFFLRYLKTQIIIFMPICGVVMPLLIPLNYVGGKGDSINSNHSNSPGSAVPEVTGLDTLAWGNVKPTNTSRYNVHLLMAVIVVVWVGAVFFWEFRSYVEIRQEHLTSPQHQQRASANTVLVCSIPTTWLTEEALRGVFDVFPGGVKNIWINKDLTKLLQKIARRDEIRNALEYAETSLIQAANKSERRKDDCGDRGDVEMRPHGIFVEARAKFNICTYLVRAFSQKSLLLAGRLNISLLRDSPDAYAQGERTHGKALDIWNNWKHRPKAGTAFALRDLYQGNHVGYNEDESDAEWRKYLEETDRPMFRPKPHGIQWLPGLPWLNKEDSIYWCRRELDRLNREIEDDQNNIAGYPDMNSAFIQFNRQIAAHMACQSVIHPVPRQMCPRIVEISPNDVIWSNMALGWWQQLVRTAVVIAVAIMMVFLWAIPVAWSAALSQLDSLIQSQEWLSFLKYNSTVENLAKAVAGLLPAAVLEVLLFLVPLILDVLAHVKGAKTGSQKTEFVQTFYFIFLFIQVFLVVSVASFFTAAVDEYWNNIKQLQTIQDILNLLAINLPKAANYFFSYMILQALSTSSGTLLRVDSLISWFIIGPLVDATPRQKWARRNAVNDINWGPCFPVYTNFACIGLIYCVIAPLISVFATITFSLLWMAHGYSMIYVHRFSNDTGGVLYPRAINQTFTGVYVMELCMAGMFFGVVDHRGRRACTMHGFTMIAMLISTIIYQIMLNRSFSPLFRYLPVEAKALWGGRAKHSGHRLKGPFLGKESTASNATATGYNADSQASHCRSGVKDTSDNPPSEDRDGLTQLAFRHSALRARQPIVWIPRDNLGVSNDEIKRTKRYSNKVPASNEGAEIDIHGCVKCKKSEGPPDFNPLECINV